MAQHKNIDLHLLECFAMLMRERNVTRAAERMGLSQSAMSEALGRLRERFDDPLLVRGSRGMQPTPHALSLIARIGEATETLRALVEPAPRFAPARCTTRFRLVASDYVQLLLLPGLVRRLAAEAPGAALDALPVNIRRVEEALELGEIDLAIAYFVEPPAGLKRRQLFRERYVGLARRGHAVAGRRVSLAALAALGHVAVAPSGLNYFSGALDDRLARAGLARKVVVTSPHFLLAASLVADTDLVLVLPERAARRLAGTLPLATFTLAAELPAVDTALYWHPRTHQSAAHAWLRDLVSDTLTARE